MKTIYIVTVDKKVSSIAYSTLEEAQEFIKARVKPENIEGQPPYYNVFSTRDYAWYTITDVRVEG